MLAIDTGVLQGCLLGVLLFQVVINDLPNCLKFSTCILYADDTTIFVIGRSLKFMKMKLQSELRSLLSWLSANHLKLNASKMKVMLFNKAGLTPNLVLTVEGMDIEMVSSFKFLGVILDVNLGFEQHYKILYKKLMQYAFINRNLAQFLPSSCLRHLYFAYFSSNVTYCMMIWYPLLKKSLQMSLFQLQK